MPRFRHAWQRHGQHIRTRKHAIQLLCQAELIKVRGLIGIPAAHADGKCSKQLHLAGKLAANVAEAKRYNGCAFDGSDGSHILPHACMLIVPILMQAFLQH